jgi:protein-tyrosine phosphatase
MQRHVQFEQAVNFRDLGGYPTGGNRRTQWRRLYRSGHLANLSQADVLSIQKLNLGLVCDLRTAEEQSRGPSRIPDTIPLSRISLDIWPPGARVPTDVVNSMIFDGETVEAVRETQREMYRNLAVEFADRYAQMFSAIIEEGGAPILVHCRGGRDRTGFGAALILSVLGVPQETIVEDYLLTNAAPTANNFISKMIRSYAEDSPSRREEDLERLFNAVFPVRAENLAAAFEAIDTHFGSMEGYFGEALNISKDARALLQSWYLEPQS